MAIDGWLSLITTAGVILLGADKILFQFRKRQWQTDSQLSSSTPIPLIARMTALEKRLDDGTRRSSEAAGRIQVEMERLDRTVVMIRTELTLRSEASAQERQQMREDIRGLQRERNHS